MIRFPLRIPDQRKGSPGPDSVIVSQSQVFTNSLLSAWAHQIRGDEPAAQAAFDSARVLLEPLAEATPDDFRVQSGLGYTYAGLGRAREAEACAERYLSGPTPNNAAALPARLEIVAQIFAQAGLADRAVEILERLLPGPSYVSIHWLRMEPIWDPIRSHPRFQALLERYADDVEH